MFDFLKRIRAKKYVDQVSIYISCFYVSKSKGSINVFSGNPQSTSSQTADSGIKYSYRDSLETVDPEIKYSYRGSSDNSQSPQVGDAYDATEVSRLLRNCTNADNLVSMRQKLDRNVNQTFVDMLFYYIDRKGVKDSVIYKAAGVDKRLFSKIASDRQYKPSKDTAIALTLALELSLDEANDMLSRAGYTLSHSSKRDIIVEFFFREQIYNLMDVNAVLYSWGQKIIGRA